MIHGRTLDPVPCKESKLQKGSRLGKVRLCLLDRSAVGESEMRAKQ